MNVAQIIATKRDGLELSAEQIDFLVSGYAAKRIEDYQLAAWAMAVYFQGMTERETLQLTRSMLATGKPLSWPPGLPKVDKHSTGGIGDKTSIPLAPILAECGVDVPMISGRGLGPTGGTLDKLESIAGFRTDLTNAEIQALIADVGCVITGASSEIAPADKRLYALRDVTGTVPAIPLITASILSKKLSEGLDALVLDVKWGNGAFMKTRERARSLALSLVRVATLMGVPTRALITDMNRPLGRMIGNGLEIDESLEILDGKGPIDSRELTIRLGAELLVLAGVQSDLAAATAAMNRAIAGGKARERFERMVCAQGGDLNQAYAKPKPRELRADRSGYLAAIDCEQLGVAVIEMGGGRKALGDTIDSGVGIEMLCQIGQMVAAGEPLAKVYSRGAAHELDQQILQAFTWSDSRPAIDPLIVEVIDSKSWEVADEN
jgi:pyrimidine-nucleoside phosphorylase